MPSLFADAHEHRFTVNSVEIFARVGGSGPPLLLIHGFPQTHAMWHRLAPALMQRFTCVMPDRRGYGFSACPEDDPGHTAYSKRAMTGDLVAVMEKLGHTRFAAVGHDRGARVAYRMALDHPQRVATLTVLDIVPTYAMWHELTVRLAMKSYHWLFLAQPAPLPEMLIEPNPAAFLDYSMASWTKSKDLSAFAGDALAEYRYHFAPPEHVRAACGDYRAGATSDLAADEADRAAGLKIACPTLALWGETGIAGKAANPLLTWQQWCKEVEGHAIDSGHFVAEENPDAVLAHLLPFLERHGR